MKLSTKSWHAMLYNWVYRDNLPNNLCPYFWKIIIGLILVIPFTILALPILIYSLIDKYVDDDMNLFMQGIAGFFIYLVLGICFIILSPFLNMIGMNLPQQLISGGWFLIGFIGSCGIIALIKKSREKSKSKEKSPNIFKEFIKAKYNKYCPKIDWKK